MQRPNPNQQLQQFQQQQQQQQSSMVMQQQTSSSTSSSVQQQSQQFMSQQTSQRQQFSSQQQTMSRTEQSSSVSRQVTQQRGQFQSDRDYRLKSYEILPETHIFLRLGVGAKIFPAYITTVHSDRVWGKCAWVDQVRASALACSSTHTHCSPACSLARQWTGLWKTQCEEKCFQTLLPWLISVERSGIKICDS